MLIFLCGAMLAGSSESYQQLMHVTEVCLRFVSFSLDECPASVQARGKQQPFPVFFDKSRLRIGEEYFSAGPI